MTTERLAASTTHVEAVAQRLSLCRQGLAEASEQNDAQTVDVNNMQQLIIIGHKNRYLPSSPGDTCAWRYPCQQQTTVSVQGMSDLLPLVFCAGDGCLFALHVNQWAMLIHDTTYFLSKFSPTVDGGSWQQTSLRLTQPVDWSSCVYHDSHIF